MANPVNDIENYLIIPNEILILVSPEVQNIWKESDAAWHLFLNERMRPQMWAKSAAVLAVKMCWDLLIPKMNPGATCDHLEYRSESSPRVDQTIINVLMWIGRDGSGDPDNAVATVPMSVRIPVPKDDEDLIITVTASSIIPTGYPAGDSRRKIRNAADILINHEEFQSEDDRNKVIRSSLRERYRNIKALEPNKIVVNDPGAPRSSGGLKTYSYYGENQNKPFHQGHGTLVFYFHFTETTLWELHLPPWFMIIKNVRYSSPNDPAAAA